MSAPFSTDPNSARDVRVQAEQGGYKPAQKFNIGQGLSALVQTAAPFLVDKHKTDVKQDLADDYRAVSTALQAAKHGGNDPFKDAALNDPVVAQAKKEYENIKAQVDQGVLPRQYALARFEEITAGAISDAPHFQQEIRSFAKGTLGFNPNEAYLKELLEKSPEQTAYEQVKVEALKNGFTIEEQVAANQAASQAAVTIAQMNALKATSAYSADMMAQEATTRASVGAMAVIEEMNQQLVANGGVLDKDHLVLAVRSQFAHAQHELLANLPAGTDVSVRNANVTQLNNMRDTYIQMVETGDLEKILTKRNDIFKKLALNNFNVTSDLAGVYNVFGAETTMHVMGIAELAEKNPTAAKFVLENTPEGLGAAGAAKHFDFAIGGLKMLDGGKTPVTENEKKQVMTGSALLLQVYGAQTLQQLQAIDALVEHGGTEVSYTTISDPKILNTIAGKKELHDPALNIFSAERESLRQVYHGLVKDGTIKEDSLEFVEGRVVYKDIAPSDDVNTYASSTTPNERMAARGKNAYHPTKGKVEQAAVNGKAANFVQRMNRFLTTSDALSRVGVLQSAQYGGAEQVIKWFDDESVAPEAEKKGASKKTLPDGTVVEQWGLDENGEIILL
jgi:hypothetical protein